MTWKSSTLTLHEWSQERVICFLKIIGVKSLLFTKIYYNHQWQEKNDGYKQREIVEYLKLSTIAISKIYKIYRQKVKLFNKLRDKGIFWSYSKDIRYEKAGENLLIEYLFKYADFDDIQQGFELFGKRVMKRVWEEKLKSDKRFIKLNFMIARVFLGMNIEANYFKFELDKSK